MGNEEGDTMAHRTKAFKLIQLLGGAMFVWGLYQMFRTNIVGTDSQFISAAWLAGSGVIIHTAARIADWLLADQA